MAKKTTAARSKKATPKAKQAAKKPAPKRQRAATRAAAKPGKITGIKPFKEERTTLVTFTGPAELSDEQFNTCLIDLVGSHYGDDSGGVGGATVSVQEVFDDVMGMDDAALSDMTPFLKEPDAPAFRRKLAKLADESGDSQVADLFDRRRSGPDDGE